MKYFLDTEFNEDGKTIDLISIGIVAEDGREYYSVNADFDWDRVYACVSKERWEQTAWLRDNVMPHVKREEGIPAKQIRDEIRTFVAYPYGPKAIPPDRRIPHRAHPEFWGYYADYDWVAFCQLYGRMIDLPENYPMFCRDIKQLAVELGNPNIPVPEINEHHALADALWNKKAYEFLVEHARQKVENERLRLPLAMLGIQ